MSRACPHCGSPLPDEAAFCPHCAQTVRPRKTPRQPVPMRKRVMVALLVLALTAVGGVWIYLANHPQVFDGEAEVVYTYKGTTYQLILAWNRDPNSLAPKIYLSEEEGGDFTWPSRWYVNYKDSGLNAAPEFLELVDHVTTEIRLGEAGACPMEASQPAPDGYDPEAAMISFIHFICGTDTNQVVWTIHMKNGDVIRLHQDMIITATQTHEIRPEDYPMNTTQELQALVDHLAEEIPKEDQIEIYLPPVTYQEMLVLERRGMNFHGCTDGTGRTAFTGGVQVRYEGGGHLLLLRPGFPGGGGRRRAVRCFPGLGGRLLLHQLEDRNYVLRRKFLGEHHRMSVCGQPDRPPHQQHPVRNLRLPVFGQSVYRQRNCRGAGERARRGHPFL